MDIVWRSVAMDQQYASVGMRAKLYVGRWYNAATAGYDSWWWQIDWVRENRSSIDGRGRTMEEAKALAIATLALDGV